MIYEIKLHPKVNKFLNKLEKDLSERIKQRLKILKKDPFLYLEHYKGAIVINSEQEIIGR